MIKPDKIKKSQAKHIIKIAEEMARAEVIARLGRFDNLEFADYHLIHIQKKDELYEYLFGTSNLVKLGERWKLLEKKGRRKKKRKNHD